MNTLTNEVLSSSRADSFTVRRGDRAFKKTRDMKQLLRLLFSCLFIFSIHVSFAQSGVPGACGYPNTQRTSSVAPQDGSGTLGNVYNVSKCGLNFIAVSNRLGQRFTPQGVPQPAPFVVSGLNPCDSIEKAFLWVEGSGTGAAQTATVAPPSGPTQNFPLTLVGQGPDKCWGYAGSVTYRADVTSVINGNGTYNISGLFTNPPTAGEDMDGATLVIIYSDKTAAYQGTMIIDDGAIVINGGTGAHNMNYPAVCGATQNAQTFICVGDIQMPIGSLTMNGTPSTIMWDWWNYVVEPTTVTIGQTTSNFTLTSTGDCFNLCVAGLYYQTTSCAVCPVSNTALSLAANATPTSSCNACDGTATVTPTPSGTYTYNWQPTGQTSQTATGLCSGTYTVTVMGNCLVSTQTVSVGNPAGLTTTSTQTDVSCFGNTDGVAVVLPAGGQGPYTYSWTPVTGTNDTLSGIPFGTYTCTVTDANGCSYVHAITITQPPGFSVTMNVTNVLCNGQSNGSAVAVATGGNPAYNYVWTPAGPNNDTLANIGIGSYTVTVTDANGCGGQQTFNITEPSALAGILSVTPAGCNGPGWAMMTPSGGTGPYTFLWSSGGTSASEFNLTVGSYVITVTDANGCTLVDTAVVTSTSTMTVAASQTDVTCFGGSNGSATAIPSGGTAPYSYSWSPFGGNNATATNLTPGTYTCTITDANGCTVTQTFIITAPPQLTATMNLVSVSCNGGADGSATITASGGSPSYTYAWSPTGGPGQTSNGLTAGSYSVTTTDANGCTNTQTFTITQPNVLSVATTPDSACAGSSATVFANSSGGTGPYTYSWSNGGQGASLTVTPAQTTTYTVTVTDANGCTTTGSVTVPVLQLPVSGFSSNAVNGVFVLGSGPLCFYDASTNAVGWYWNFNNVDSSMQQSPCVAVTPGDTGAYCVTLVTQNGFGCADTAATCIEISNVSYSIPNVFTPNGDGSNDVFVITNSGMKSLRCRIYDRWGVLVYEWDGTTGGWDGKTLNGKEATDGVYYFTAYMVDLSEKVYEGSGFLHLIRGN